MNQIPRIRGVFLSHDPETLKWVWGTRQRERLSKLVELLPEVVNADSLADHAEWLKDTQVIFSTWGMPRLTEEQLRLLPNLRAVFYAAGSVKPFAEPLFDRNVTVVSAWAANAVPVAEFTLSQILFGLKLGWQHHRQFREHPGPEGWKRLDIPGAYGATVGLVSLGMIGRKVCQLLQHFQLRKLAYDPFVGDDTLQEYGVMRAESLEEVFSKGDVVTVHTPWLKETEGIISGALLARMKPNATFINTSRGALVREDEMIDVLRSRPDLTAVLDVTWPEPPEEGSPIYSLPNVVLTPHIAGSMGSEVLRMADLMIEEFLLWVEGQPLRYAVTRELMERIA
jgi:Phosphoglycerate dehydrogenase and related dehydrogenases